MEEVFVVATIITLSFCLSKFIETKYFTEETKPLKDTVRDCLLVMMCSKSNTSKTHMLFKKESFSETETTNVFPKNMFLEVGEGRG